MPLNKKGKKIMRQLKKQLKKQYGTPLAKKVFYGKTL
mgnify:CR=1 FL=1